MPFSDGVSIRDHVRATMATICDQWCDTVSPPARCLLPAGHDGAHRALMVNGNPVEWMTP